MSSLFMLASAFPTKSYPQTAASVRCAPLPWFSAADPTILRVACGDTFQPPAAPTNLPFPLLRGRTVSSPPCFLRLTEPFERLRNLLNLNVYVYYKYI